MIKIVKAEERHVFCICQLWLEFMQYSADIDPFYTLREVSTAGFENGYLRPALASEKSLVLVAIDGEKAVGYSHAEVQDVPNNRLRQVGHVQHLFINEAYRRRGIGDKMYTAILKWFRAVGIVRVELQVIVKNKSAVSFWKKHGYIDFQNILSKDI